MTRHHYTCTHAQCRRSRRSHARSAPRCTRNTRHEARRASLSSLTLPSALQVLKKIKEHHKKKAKELKKKGGRTKAAKDLGVPASWPFREQLMKEMAFEKERVEAATLARKEAAKERRVSSRRRLRFALPSPLTQRSGGEAQGWRHGGRRHGGGGGGGGWRAGRRRGPRRVPSPSLRRKARRERRRRWPGSRSASARCVE